MGLGRRELAQIIRNLLYLLGQLLLGFRQLLRGLHGHFRFVEASLQRLPVQLGGRRRVQVP